MTGDTFGCHSCGVTVAISWVEAKDAAKHPTTHRAAPPSQKVNGAELEKFLSKNKSGIY